jgi:hypothetical protein
MAFAAGGGEKGSGDEEDNLWQMCIYGLVSV